MKVRITARCVIQDGMHSVNRVQSALDVPSVSFQQTVDKVITLSHCITTNITAAACDPCPEGMYQDEVGQTQCKPCSPGWHGATEGDFD